MIKAGDKVLLLPSNSGKRIAIKLDPIKKGDKVALIPTSSGKRIAVKLNPIKIGDKVVLLTTSSGKKIALKCGDAPNTITEDSVEISNNVKVQYNEDEESSH